MLHHGIRVGIRISFPAVKTTPLSRTCGGLKYPVMTSIIVIHAR